MMTEVRRILMSVFMVFLCANAVAFEEDLPITKDSRIKTYVYNPSEVYMLVLHHGYQSHIEFAQGESIETISLGDSYAWKISPLGHRLFIRPLESNIRTNMTIITNKRAYQFDLISKELELGNEYELVYQIKFFYPKKRFK
jgi:type IV secretion system protein VirB9